MMPEFEDFFAAHYEPVRRALVLALRDIDQAEDLAQEAFARALRHWVSVSHKDRPVVWVYVVAMNQARRDFRRAQSPAGKREPRRSTDLSSAVVTTVCLKTALERLSPRQRAAVVLRYLADLSTAETARAMGCAEGTVKSALHEALAHLRVELEEEEI
jgi:RNA polymerase sigma-70 factor (ECF subfamily)